jgi:hypothetical protein
LYLDSTHSEESYTNGFLFFGAPQKEVNMMETKQTIFERMDGTYTLGEDGIYYPNLVLGEESPHYGKYGGMRKRYLQQHRPALYAQLVLEGKLVAHLNEVDDTCNNRIKQVADAVAEAEGITEVLKATNQMEWVRRMESIRSRAEDVVCHELIYE